MSDIFVSYSHDDREQVASLVERLEAEGWSVWWDRTIGSGAVFDAQIEQALEKSSRVLVMWSASSIDSHWVRAEAHEGLERGILIPVLLDDLRPPLAFRQIQTVNLFETPGNFACVVEALRSSFETKTSPLSAPQRPYSSKERPARIRLRKLALVALAILLFAWLFWTGLPPHQPAPSAMSPVRANSIAVLPFLNLSDSSGSDYFSDGISEEILSRLAAIKGLAVIARTSSFALRNSNLNVGEIGELLRVANVLEGGVRQSQGKVRVNAQLVNTSDGSLIWSSTFDRELTDIFEIQEEIAESIASALALQLVTDTSQDNDSRSTDDLAAYDLYLLGRFHLHERTAVSIEKSISLFEQAIAESPGFVLPYTGLADAYNLLTAYGNLSGPTAADMMEPVVQKALALDDSLAEAHTSLGALRENLGDLGGAEEAYRHAIELNENYSLAYMWLGNVLISQNRLQEAEDSFARAHQLDPLNPPVNLNLARAQLSQGQFVEGMALIDRMLEFNPGYAGALEQKVYWMILYGQYTEAARFVRTAGVADSGGPQVLSTLARLEALQGNFKGARDLLNQASQVALNNWTVIWVKCEFYFLSGESSALDAYAQERLLIVARDEARSSRDLKSAYLWAGLASLLLEDNERAASYFDAAHRDSQYAFDADSELMLMVWRAMAHQRLPDSANADQALDDAVRFAMTASAQGWATPSFLAQSAAVWELQGNRDRALEELQRAIDAGFRNLIWLRRDPVWSNLNSDPRFVRLTAPD